MNRKNMIGLGIAVLSLLAPLAATRAAEDLRPTPEATCKKLPPAKGKSRQRFDATSFMVVAGELEAQGEKNFRLAYEPPKGECLVERIDLAGQNVTAIYNPWEKGTQTLLYRFVTEDKAREMLVLYNSLVGLVAKGGYGFHVSETRNGIVSFYAMFKEEPTYEAVKNIASEILSESAKPLLAVRWPEGAKEGEVVAFDSSRLK
ncbi:hypothetical protein [Steroidobacter cummioxidans]|uniref:hypothetical protein n=1 Tax=Steroidobacter cummioxidans TaxID=1803913 RepID=UPI00128FCEFE|nr:hypothetical protein [Steroidobacter cummioxidans]